MPGRLVAWLGLVGTLTIINYAGRAAGGKPPKNAVYHYSLAVGGLVQYAVILGIVLLIAGKQDRRRTFALRAPASWARALGLLAVVLVSVYVLTGVLSPILHPGREQGFSPNGWDSSRAGAFAASFLVLAVVGPVVEELMFRGLGFSLLEPYGEAIAIGGIGLTFALVHGLIEAFPILLAFGAGLAWVRSRSGSVYPGMVAHCAFNAIALTVAVTT